MSDIKTGESTTREGLPDEVFLRVMRRFDAEQNRHLTMNRIADALEKFTAVFERLGDQAQRTADILDRAFPVPEDEPEEVPVTEAGLPIPPWIGEESGVVEDTTTAEDWGERG